ncbi:MAG TPA: N-acetyltransferase, partial [Vicinamibacterales bacterium]|nr:N-acetyltransferase [Vicinamibacterales bacterium]
PGFVARLSTGAVAGWTYYLLHDSELQIGALAATSPAIAAALLDAVLASAPARVAARTLFFAFTAAPAITEVLAERGFDARAHHYLARPLAAAPPAGTSFHAWHDGALAPASEVLAAAYGGPDRRRAFVPSGTAADWRHYVQQLTTSTGCGRFQPALTRLAGERSGALDGLALVTAVSATSAHLAQLAVRPDAAGAGLGARLLADVTRAAADAGYARLSLLVSADNDRARRLYEAAGFTRHASFVAATRSGRRSARTGASAA